jgi:hypothetical protein
MRCASHAQPSFPPLLPTNGNNFSHIPPPPPPHTHTHTHTQIFKSYARDIPALCQPRDLDDPNATAVLRVPTRLVCGGLAGAIGQTIVYPLDTVCLNCLVTICRPLIAFRPAASRCLYMSRDLSHRFAGACRWMASSMANPLVRKCNAALTPSFWLQNCFYCHFRCRMFPTPLLNPLHRHPFPPISTPFHPSPTPCPFRQVQRQVGQCAASHLAGRRHAWNVSPCPAIVVAQLASGVLLKAINANAMRCFNTEFRYRGLSINYIRVVPMVSISFTAFDLIKNFLEPL